MADPLRILNLSLGSGRAGSGVFAVALSKKLSQMGHRVVQACSTDSFTLVSARKENLQTLVINLKGLFAFKEAKKLAEYANDNNIQIINVHHSRERYLAIFAKRLFGCKSRIVITRHAVSGTVPFLGSLIYNWGADMNIAVSKVVFQSLKRDLTLKKKLIYGGIDAEKFKTPDLEKINYYRKSYLNFSLQRPVVGMVADYDPHGKNTRGHGKGHPVLFEAVKFLKKKVLLLLIGPLKKDCKVLLQLAVKKGVSPDQVLILPFQEDVIPFYSLMDMHVLPSYSESLGLVTLEAMAAGIPCIGTNIGGINEIIDHGKNGLLFSAGDARDLADQINFFLENPGPKQEIAIAGKKTVEKFFNMDRVATETSDLFYQLMKSG